jgi:inner membrane protein
MAAFLWQAFFMPTLFTHAVIAGSLGQTGRAEWRSDWRFWFAAIACSILPDIDTLGFRMGIRYGDLWGHRGMTHSLLFAAVLAATVTLLFRRVDAARWKLLLLLFVITASHGFFDAMTNGGLGVAFFSPFDTRRYFLPWRPIPVSPIGAGRFFSARGVYILTAEAMVVWISMLIFAAIILVVRNANTAAARQERPSTQRKGGSGGTEEKGYR